MSLGSVPDSKFPSDLPSSILHIFVPYQLPTKKLRKGNNTNDSFGKGFHVLKDHVLNRLMTGRCPHTSLLLRPNFHSLFLQNSFDFQKSATFKGLKASQNRRLLQNRKVTHRQTDKVTTVTVSRMCAVG